MRITLFTTVYNRPDEVAELLATLAQQTRLPDEILIVEDGSSVPCKKVVEGYTDRLPIRYLYQENTGQGFARNTAYAAATGDLLIVVDSDCLLPEDYVQIVERDFTDRGLEVFGGPDAAHPSFTPLQKAIGFSMTSFFTTGGIRGQREEGFHPRSFNMGITREVYEKTKGYLMTKKGEDIEFSMRLKKMGLKIGLIAGAKVYHKRRTSLAAFWRQVKFFGTARINVYRLHKDALKPVFLMPLGFMLYVTTLPVWLLGGLCWFLLAAAPFALFLVGLFVEGLIKLKSLPQAVLGVACGFVQLYGYGVGFLQEGLRYLGGKKEPDYLKPGAVAKYEREK